MSSPKIYPIVSRKSSLENQLARQKVANKKLRLRHRLVSARRYEKATTASLFRDLIRIAEIAELEEK